MRPASTVWADHVGSVTDWAKDKAIILRLDDLLVADSDSEPVAWRFFDHEGKLLAAFAALHSRLHYGELISRVLVGLDCVLAQQFDVNMLGLLCELVARRVPDLEIIDELQYIFLVLRQTFVCFLHAEVDGLADVLTWALKRCDEVSLWEIGMLVLWLARNRSH